MSGLSDLITADEIAHALLGKCARAPDGWAPQGEYTHYIKIIGLSEKDTKEFYEVGMERGVTIMEIKQ